MDYFANSFSIGLYKLDKSIAFWLRASFIIKEYVYLFISSTSIDRQKTAPVRCSFNTHIFDMAADYNWKYILIIVVRKDFGEYSVLSWR